MTDLEFNIDELTINDLIKRINPKFFKWISIVKDLNKARTLEIATFFLNFYIVQNYFPSINELYEQMPEDFKKTLPKVKIREFRMNFERIFNLLLMIVLKFKNKIFLSSEETDEKISELEGEGSLINSFFIFNINPKNLKIGELKHYFEKYFIPDHLFPNLHFDPLFDKIIRSDAVKHIFFITSPRNLLNFTGDREEFKYFPEKKQFLYVQKLRENYGEKLFNIDSSLKISKLNQKFLNHIGIFDFGSHKLINDLISLLINYYIGRLPSKASEIRNNFECFSLMLKLCNGKLFQKFRYSKFIKKMSKMKNNEKITQYIKNFCCSVSNQDFIMNYKDFDPRSFLREYHTFLKYSCYKYSGFIYFGVYLVWRALIKYMEELQQEKVFKKKKGQLLENWCYYKALEYGFKAEKLILKNVSSNPTKKYLKMKKQIEEFPKNPIEIELDFNPEDSSYFREIDIVFRIENYLFLFECKGTSARVGEEGRLYSWGTYFEKNMDILSEKASILYSNIKSKKVNHPLLNDIEEMVLEVIKTEGLLGEYGVMFPIEFEQYLKKLKEQINQGTFKEYYEKGFKYLS